MPDQQARHSLNGLIEVPSSCLILIKSSRGKIKDIRLPVPEGLDPMAFGTAVAKAYVQNVGKFKRLYYHCVLFKQPVVSIASLAKVCIHCPERPGPCRYSCLRTGVPRHENIRQGTALLTSLRTRNRLPALLPGRRPNSASSSKPPSLTRPLRLLGGRLKFSAASNLGSSLGTLSVRGPSFTVMLTTANPPRPF